MNDIKKMILKRKGYEAAGFKLYEKLSEMIPKNPDICKSVWNYQFDRVMSTADLIIVSSDNKEFLENVGFRISYINRKINDKLHIVDWRKEGWFDNNGNYIPEKCIPDDVEIVFQDIENSYDIPIYIKTDGGRFELKDLLRKMDGNEND